MFLLKEIGVISGPALHPSWKCGTGRLAVGGNVGGMRLSWSSFQHPELSCSDGCWENTVRSRRNDSMETLFLWLVK